MRTPLDEANDSSDLHGSSRVRVSGGDDGGDGSSSSSSSILKRNT